MRRWNGWGDESNSFPLKEKGKTYLASVLQGKGTILEDASLEEVLAKVPASRLPAHALVSQDAEVRMRHARGQSFADWLAMRSGEFGSFPDGVAMPKNSNQVREVLDWAYQLGAIIIIYGGGTSVAGHINIPASTKPVLTLSLEDMNQLIALDDVSQVATFGAGTAGPDVERQLKHHGYVLGHFPQSWELSTVGGWVASRSSGQQSVRYGRIEQMFAGAHVETPQGSLDIPDIPASAAGIDLREILMGSEGRIGVISEVKVRVTRLPEHESFHVAFLPNWDAGVRLVREMVQRKIPLSMMRLSNPCETTSHLALGGDHPLFRTYDQFVSLRGCKDGTRVMFTFGVTGSKRQAKFALSEAKKLIAQFKGSYLASELMGKIWEHSRFRSPYLRHTLWEAGYSVDTFETCVNWCKVTETMNAMEQGIRLASGHEPVLVFTHLSHMYGQGCSIYSTYIFKNSPTYAQTLQRWEAYKTAANDAIVSMGATMSHQHGVGRDHAAWLKFEKGEQGMEAMRTLIHHFDPAQQLNPGCLLGDDASAQLLVARSKYMDSMNNSHTN